MDVLKRRYDFTQRAKGRQVNADPYGLSFASWPSKLRTEFEAYRDWRLAVFNPDRPKRLRQRPVSFEKDELWFTAYFGYLVNVRGMRPAGLHLAHMADPKLVRGFAEWHAAERANGTSRFVQRMTGLCYRLARYYLNAPPEQWTPIETLMRASAPDGVVRDKRRVTVPLATLEQIGLAEYPGVDALASASADQERRRLAFQVQRSLIVRLLVRRPMRSRNIRELRLGESLRRDDAGQWTIEFSGKALKIERRKGRVNTYQITWPPDLGAQLDEFLSTWRPLLNGHDRAELFVTKTGRPFTADGLNAEIKKCIYAYTGRAFNVHLFRSVWASEYITSTQDFVTVATLLGDDVQTVLGHYADLVRGDAGALADRFTLAAVADDDGKGNSDDR